MTGGRGVATTDHYCTRLQTPPNLSPPFFRPSTFSPAPYLTSPRSSRRTTPGAACTMQPGRVAAVPETRTWWMPDASVQGRLEGGIQSSSSRSMMGGVRTQGAYVQHTDFGMAVEMGTPDSIWTESLMYHPYRQSTARNAACPKSLLMRDTPDGCGGAKGDGEGKGGGFFSSLPQRKAWDWAITAQMRCDAMHCGALHRSQLVCTL